MKITRIQITGLYGRDFDIPIINNKIILTGMNGTCKSAVLKLVSIAFCNIDIRTHKFERMIITVDGIDHNFLSIDGLVVGTIPLNDEFNVFYVNKEIMLDTTEVKRNTRYLPTRYILEQKDSFDLLNKYFDTSKKKKPEHRLIDPDELSDGERKIFRFIYNISDIEKKYLIFFDDIETSLSVEWQKRFLPDVLNTGKCSFLMGATHSPFVFENELNDYAVEISNFSNQ
jgi:predicted ATP-binding protein involved in virulence